MESTLNIDLFFFAALQQSSALRTMVGDRIFDTYRNSTAEQQDKIPYIIVTTGASQSTQGSKDEYTDAIDVGGVSVLCVAKDTQSLANLQHLVLSAVSDANEDDTLYDAHDEWDFPHLYITPSAGEKMADPEKPCLFRELHFACAI